MRIDLKPKRAAQTLFQSRTELKLVTQCKASTRYRDYLLLEHKIYQAYNLVTPLSFRTRLLSVTYLDTDGEIREFTQPAFLIEDLEERLRGSTWNASGAQQWRRRTWTPRSRTSSRSSST